MSNAATALLITIGTIAVLILWVPLLDFPGPQREKIYCQKA